MRTFWLASTLPAASVAPNVSVITPSALTVAAIEQAGVVSQSAARRFIQVLKPVQVASITADADALTVELVDASPSRWGALDPTHDSARSPLASAYGQ